MSKYIVVLLIIFGGGQAKGQMSLRELDFFRIPQKKIKKFIKQQIKNHKVCICDLSPSCPLDKDVSNFHKHEKEYLIDNSLQKVWNNYIHADPVDAWKSNKVSLGCVVSKNENDVMYRDDKYFGIDTGQVYFLNLKLMVGVYNLAVAFEVINLDEENKIIEFSYIEGGKALGKQQLHFVADGEKYTKIIHTSRFKSDSAIRDRFLYPFFHERLINQFHDNMLNIISSEEVI